MTPTPLCLKTKIRAFSNIQAPDFSIRAALKVCRDCPIRKQCARMALTAGNSLDGSVIAVADGVIQAGVVCTGNRKTVEQLAAVAGVSEDELPNYILTPTRGKLRPGAPCKHCSRPMWRWTRKDNVPKGYVMHYARGYCVRCRKAYKQEYPTGQQRGLRKPVDRKNHHDATLAARQRTAQKRAAKGESM